MLNPAFKQASGALAELLAIPYDRKSIEECGNQLLEHLSESDSRNANSLATLAYYTQKFCDLAGVDFDALQFIKTTICPQTNDQGSGKDSLTDFLENLAILKAENVVGDWNLNECQSRDGAMYLAIHMAGIWKIFEDRFKPNYSKNLVENLAEEKGGLKNDKRYFVASRDTAKAFQKALADWEMGIAGSHAPVTPKRDRAAKSLLIPRSIAEKAGFFPTEPSPEPIAVPEPEPIAVPTPEPEPTTSVTVDLTGEWREVDDVLWPQDAIDDARQTIQNDPATVCEFKKLVPRSQWGLAGITMDGRCAA